MRKRVAIKATLCLIMQHVNALHTERSSCKILTTEASDMAVLMTAGPALSQHN